MSRPTYPLSPYTYQDYPFLKNKWYPHYIKLMETRQALNRKHTKGSSKTSRHHVLPLSLGGSNRKDNIVVLTYKEHFIAHALLVRITEGQNWHKMVHAFNWMCRCPIKDSNTQTEFEHYRHSRVYAANMENVPLSLSIINTGKKRTPEFCEHMRALYSGKKTGPQSKETIEKKRMASTGRKQTPESIEKIRRANTGRRHTDIARENMSKAHQGKTRTTEAKLKTTESLILYHANHKGKTNIHLKKLEKISQSNIPIRLKRLCVALGDITINQLRLHFDVNGGSIHRWFREKTYPVQKHITRLEELENRYITTVNPK